MIALIAPAVASAQDSDNDGLDDVVDPCLSEPRNLCYGVVAVDAASGLPVRLNAGAKRAVECSGTRTDCTGRVWQRDFGFNQFERTFTCDLFGGGESCVISGIEPLFGCTDENTEDLFQCEHFDRLVAPDLAYSFAVGNGDYLLNLFFANTFTRTTEPGTRLFDVLVEGEVVLDDFDQVAAAGGNGVAVVRSFLVSVTDGTLDIQFGHVAENPSLKGIELLKRVPCLTALGCQDGDACNGIETCESLFCRSGTPVVCGSNEICETETGTCLEKGGPCTGDVDCVGGEVCNTATSHCQPLGGPCDDASDCAGGEACNSAAGSCQALGEDCAEDDDCTDGEGCHSVEEECRPRGGPCEDDLDCVRGEFCSGTTCAPCTSDDDCAGAGACLTCVDGACADTSQCDDTCEKCVAGACASACTNPFQTTTSETTSGDALYALRSALGLQTCALCLCDATGDGQVTAADALGILRYALGLSQAPQCPVPVSSTTSTTVAPTTTTLATTTTVP